MDPSSLRAICAPGTRDHDIGARVSRNGRLEAEQMASAKGKT